MNQTTGPLLIETSQDRDLIFESWQSEIPIMVHAEGETIEVAIKLAKKYKKPLHVCHIVSDQIDTIKKARAQGIAITCEVCPHHLFLTKNDVSRLGPLSMMKPPLPSKKDQQKLWDNLDKIDIIASDHAPHTLAEKYDQSSPKYGVPGLETTLPLMLSAVAQSRISLARLVEMTSINPQRIFRLPSQQDTYILVDVTKKYKIANKGLFTKCGWTPFEGMDGRGEIKKVVIRGQTVYEDGKFIGKPTGKVIYPQT